uniref:Uncharacterized protein n=1 Tax=Nitzschia sp. PL3-2 TaxID=2083271 RepID=A0A2Z5ZAA1_9STRA|nr:hypothetical protein [Nitzschia sp. PL3-2]
MSCWCCYNKNELFFLMILIFSWSSFIILISFLDELTQFNYLIASLIMFCLTYLFNYTKHIALSARTTIILLNIPGMIFWYIAFVYNDFLCITPLSDEVFMGLFFFYSYLNLYFYLEFPYFKQPLWRFKTF